MTLEEICARDSERMRKLIIKHKLYLSSVRFFTSLLKRKRFPKNMGDEFRR